jgi:hypothetical protein
VDRLVVEKPGQPGREHRRSGACGSSTGSGTISRTQALAGSFGFGCGQVLLANCIGVIVIGIGINTRANETQWPGCQSCGVGSGASTGNVGVRVVILPLPHGVPDAEYDRQVQRVRAVAVCQRVMT